MTDSDAAPRANEGRGIVLGLDEASYRARPGLSSSGARALLRAAKVFDYERTHPPRPKAAFDLGAAVHAKVLGSGRPVIAYPEEHLTPSGNVSTKAATVEWSGRQRAAGIAVVTPGEMARVEAMAEAVLAHPDARALLEQDGAREASAFATDPDTGAPVRARFDLLPSPAQPDAWCVELTTTSSGADAASFARTVASSGYEVQQEHRLHAYGLASGDPAGRMRFVVVETAPPHLVAVHELSPEFARIGAGLARRARELFAECTASGEWPGLPRRSEPLRPPRWHLDRHAELTG